MLIHSTDWSLVEHCVYSCSQLIITLFVQTVLNFDISHTGFLRRLSHSDKVNCPQANAFRRLHSQALSYARFPIGAFAWFASNQTIYHLKVNEPELESPQAVQHKNDWLASLQLHPRSHCSHWTFSWMACFVVRSADIKVDAEVLVVFTFPYLCAFAIEHSSQPHLISLTFDLSPSWVPAFFLRAIYPLRNRVTNKPRLQATFSLLFAYITPCDQDWKAILLFFFQVSRSYLLLTEVVNNWSIRRRASGLLCFKFLYMHLPIFKSNLDSLS